jgi:hypothetical protein
MPEGEEADLFHTAQPNDVLAPSQQAAFPCARKALKNHRAAKNASDSGDEFCIAAKRGKYNRSAILTGWDLYRS